MRRVYLAYALSGFVSLGYQVVWFRIWTDRFGSGTLGFALVVCAFLLGLGGGALASRWVTQQIAARCRLTQPLRQYGLVELLVSATAMLTPLLAPALSAAAGDFPYALSDGIYELSILFRAMQVVAAVLCVGLPCFLMGVTYPLLCDAFRPVTDNDVKSTTDRRIASGLYAWNTLGAALAVVVCQFALLRTLGHDVTFWVMVGLNGLIGAGFLLRGTAWSPMTLDVETIDSAEQLDTARPSVEANTTHATASHASLVFLAVLGGFMAGAIEGDAVKRVWFLGGTGGSAMAFVSFWAVLAIFVASTVVRRVAALRLWHIKAACVVAVVVYTAVCYFAYPIRDALNASSIETARQQLTEGSAVTVRFQVGLLQVAVFTGLFVFPAMFGVSMLLPWVCDALQRSGRRVGLAYGGNTVAFCIGLIVFMWIAPRVNAFYAMRLIVPVLAVAVVGLILVRASQRLTWWRPALVVAALSALAILTPRTFNPNAVTPNSPAAQFADAVSHLRSNGAHTTYVVEEPAGKRLYFDNHSMSATHDGAQRYMRHMAHFPLLAQEAPQRALLIGFGVGNTASAIAMHGTILQLDVVELNTQVVRSADAFDRTHGGVQRDSRVRFIHDDGRHYLRATNERYDLITSEPPPPMQDGVQRLYSVEYYCDAAARLTPTGLMSQWLPAYQMPARAARMAVASFIDVFPHALMFVGHGREFILVGGAQPIDLKRIEQRFNASDFVRLDLRRFGTRRAVDLLARVVMGPSQLRAFTQDAPTVSDQRNDFATTFMAASGVTTLPYDPAGWLDELNVSSLANANELRRVVTHLGRLRHRVPDFPVLSFNYPNSADHTPDLSGADWVGIERLQREAASAESVRERLRALGDLLDISDALPGIHVQVGVTHMNARQADRAVLAFRRAIAIDPDDDMAYALLGDALRMLGEDEAAREAYDKALAIDPYSPHAQAGRERAGVE